MSPRGVYPRRPRLATGVDLEDLLECAHCHGQVVRSAAVIFNGVPMHPIGCFEAELAARKGTLQRALKKAGLA